MTSTKKELSICQFLLVAMKNMAFKKNTTVKETNAQQETKIYGTAVYAEQYHLCE